MGRDGIEAPRNTLIWPSIVIRTDRVTLRVTRILSLSTFRIRDQTTLPMCARRAGPLAGSAGDLLRVRAGGGPKPGSLLALASSPAVVIR